MSDAVLMLAEAVRELTPLQLVSVYLRYEGIDDDTAAAWEDIDDYAIITRLRRALRAFAAVGFDVDGYAVRKRPRLRERRCAMCGARFCATAMGERREPQMYCSPACRQKAYRYRKVQPVTLAQSRLL